MDKGESEGRALELAIANRIRAYRKKLNWTLEDLSRSIGLSTGHLSQIENGEKTPPISTLTKIAFGLGVSTTTLITGKEDRRRRYKKLAIGRCEERIPVANIEAAADSLFEAFGLTKPDRVMDAHMITLGKSFPAKASMHVGQEFIFTVEGSYEFNYDGESYILNCGDAIYFDSNRPHMGCSVGKDQAKILVVTCNGVVAQNFLPMKFAYSEKVR